MDRILWIAVIVTDILLWLVAFVFYKKYRKLGKKKNWATKEYMAFDYTTIVAWHLIPIFATLMRYRATEKMGWLIAFGVFTGFFLAFSIHSIMFYIRLWKDKKKKNDKDRSSKGGKRKRV